MREERITEGGKVTEDERTEDRKGKEGVGYGRK